MIQATKIVMICSPDVGRNVWLNSLLICLSFFTCIVAMMKLLDDLGMVSLERKMNENKMLFLQLFSFYLFTACYWGK